MVPPVADEPSAEPSTGERARRLVRREPPRFRVVAVESVEPLTPHMVRVWVGGPELEGLTVDQPAASVRVLLPDDDGELVMPTWDGNEFLRADGTRPAIRTFTPRHLAPEGPSLAVDVVLHEGGRASAWARTAEPGDPVAVSGTGRGFDPDPEVGAFLLAGDETALPAIAQLLEAIRPEARLAVHVEISRPEARMELPRHPGATTSWHVRSPSSPAGEELVAAVSAVPSLDDTHVWAAGEAAAVQRLRTLLADRDVPRSRTTVRGYWKHGRAGT